MSVQFGKWNLDGEPIPQKEVDAASILLAPYAPDTVRSYRCDAVHILHFAFHTTKESLRETQPHVMPSGEVLVWDGRLDNRDELLNELKAPADFDLTDLAIVSMAYQRWRTDCFVKFVGDWALSIWSPAERCLLLAGDFLGVRHLYYSTEKQCVTWCTVLDPLVRSAKPLTLNLQYVSGWLSFFPAPETTPYREIHRLPPACWLSIRPRSQQLQKYWGLALSSPIRHRNDHEYEEHFRASFSQAVRRRLRAESPITAELSGGMDSSSIVCMADAVIASGAAAETPPLQTLSYYNESEPHWNERPYFARVEEKRGEVGCHIDIGNQEALSQQFNHAAFACTPAFGAASTEVSRQVAAYLTAAKSRVVLSGVGGDEVSGGVPNALPELQDYLVRGRWRLLLKQLQCWALAKNKTCFRLLSDVCLPFFPLLAPLLPHRQPAPWLNPDFLKRNPPEPDAFRRRIRLLGPLPSLQNSLSTLDGLRRQLAASALPSNPPFERRYPFLDRHLLEFLFRIPREQLVRPGQRRSLMRRSLAGIVPEELLHRKRKAYTSCSPLRAVRQDLVTLQNLTREMLIGRLGIVNVHIFSTVLDQARLGLEVPVIPVMRTLTLEFWMRTARDHGIFHTDPLDSAMSRPGLRPQYRNKPVLAG
jgi:asparagine synthase (glutamine-hydrolysing)